MSAIDKLLIRGIRSFDPDTAAVIEFYSPVTLIVGHNGAGKTSIIECLKYATTGDQPPNTKGGAFVHDPKLCGETEVKGQVKLKFRNVRNQTLVVTRSLQSSMKRGGKLEQKTLESLLVTTDPVTGEQVSISSRVSELDTEIPIQLGVSKAVLEDVIFCHQEDSQWPLSEPSILKKRFDDLFAATKYTKALDALRSSRKDLMNDLKVETQKLEYLLHDRGKAQKIVSTMNTTKETLAEYRTRIETYNHEIEECMRNIEALRGELESMSGVLAAMDRLSHEDGLLNNSISDILSEIGQEMSEPDVQLDKEIEEFDKIIDNQSGEVEKLETEKGTLLATVSTRESFANTLLAEKGQVMATIDELLRKKNALHEAFNALCLIFDFTGDLPEDDPDRVSTTFQTLLLESSEKAAAMKAALEQSISNKASTVSDLLAKKSFNEELRKLNVKNMSQQRQGIIKIMEQLEERESSESQISDLNSSLQIQEEELNLAKQQMDSKDYQSNIASLSEQRNTLEAKIKQLNDALSEQSLLAEDRAKYDVKVAEITRKRAVLDKLNLEMKADLSHFELSNESSSLDKDVDSVVKTKDQETKEIKERLDSAILKKTMLSKQKESLEASIADKETFVKSKLHLISDNLAGKNLDDEIERLESDRKTALTASVDSESLKKYAASMQSTHSCPVCDRAFADKVEEKCTIQRVENRSAAARTLDLSSIESQLQKLKSLKAISDECDAIRRTEVPALTQTIQQVSDDLEAVEIDIEEIKSEISKQSLNEKKLALLKRKVDEYTRVSREVKILAEEISFAERNLKASSSSITDLRAELSSYNEKYSAVRREHEEMVDEYRKREADVKLLEDRFRDTKEEMMKLKLKHNEKDQLQRSKLETEETIKALEAENESITAKLESLETELNNLISLIESEKEAGNLEISRLEVMNEKKRIALMNYTGQVSVIAALSNPEERLAIVQAQIDQVRTEIQSLKTKCTEVDSKLNTIKQGSSQLMTRHRHLKLNKKIRELKVRRQQLQEELNRIQEQIKGFNRDAKSSNLNKAQLRLNDLMGERSGLAGEIKQLEEQCSRMEKELSTDFGKIEEKYNEQAIKVEASKMAADDLERYAKALDQAIIRYHSAKMEEVNRTLRELWGSVYTGSDIDAVEIRADQEGDSGQRSYNYRVVMIKGSIELDMRGRSSAGQRVLTSLLIRLALADTFASNCGVLALDEPTTNLDRENIAALAEALADLIRARREQHNFQLIIITHDEEFVEALARHECAEHYWRVSKNNKQNSIIERQSLKSF